jgi:hypothetical protein
MPLLRRALWGLVLSATLLWLPSGSGAVPTSQLCEDVGNNLWVQWRVRALPKTNETIAKVLKIKQDCPQLDGSIKEIVGNIVTHQVKQLNSHKNLQKVLGYYEKTEKHNKNFESQASPYDPGGMPGPN